MFTRSDYAEKKRRRRRRRYNVRLIACVRLLSDVFAYEPIIPVCQHRCSCVSAVRTAALSQKGSSNTRRARKQCRSVWRVVRALVSARFMYIFIGAHTNIYWSVVPSNRSCRVHRLPETATHTYIHAYTPPAIPSCARDTIIRYCVA